MGLRLIDAHERDIERALAERTIVRSWPMRGTLHFLAASDARWVISLLALRALAKAVARLKALGIDDDVVANARRALVKNLEGGRLLTRPAAYKVLEQARVETAGQRGLHVLWRLAHEGLLCFGSCQGKQQTFALLEEWLPNARGLRREEALPELARRYFTRHGPATLRDFAWWSGMTLTEARLATDMAGSLIEQDVVDGQRYWFADSAGGTSSGCEVERAHVLPAFDEFFVGYADRSAALVGLTRSVNPFEIHLALGRYARFVDLKGAVTQPRARPKRSSRSVPGRPGETTPHRR